MRSSSNRTDIAESLFSHATVRSLCGPRATRAKKPKLPASACMAGPLFFRTHNVLRPNRGTRGTMNSARTILHVSALSALLIVGACTVVPTSGPAGHDIREGQADPKSLRYAYVEVTPRVVDILATNAPRL